MQRSMAVDRFARWLFTALGVAVPACGGSTDESATSNNPHPCKNPTPILVNGKATGVDSCGTRSVRRTDAVTCPEAMPRANPCTATQMDCAADTDCGAQAHGYCNFFAGGGGAPSTCSCAYGCVSDNECPEGQRCLCGDPVGRCVPATCSTAADCQEGFDCMSPFGTCASPSLACQTQKDECSSDDDCSVGLYCGVTDGHRSCQPDGCAGLGRPFLVNGVARLAPVATRSDFASLDRPSLDDLDDSERAALAEHWTRVGLMEHASVAAFARFTLQLLGLGAPAELVRDASAAQADETRHAELAFAFASAYAGLRLGPGALDLSGALAPLERRRLLSDVVREGCIGETLAAVEADFLSEHVLCPVVRAALGQIALEETRHAGLAWQFVNWLLDTEPELRAFAVSELGHGIDELRLAVLPDAQPGSERRHALGMLDDRERLLMRKETAERVLVPLQRLLSKPREREGALA
ncbi:MAG: ferritin-like domain-containing protein [Polyangiaceae bacterium]